MSKVQVRIEPPKWPEDPKEREELFEKMRKEAMRDSQKELEFLLRVIEEQKKAPPSDWLIGRAA